MAATPTCNGCGQIKTQPGPCRICGARSSGPGTSRPSNRAPKTAQASGPVVPRFIFFNRAAEGEVKNPGEILPKPPNWLLAALLLFAALAAGFRFLWNQPWDIGLPAFLFLCCILSFLFRQLGKLSTLAMMMTRGSPHGKWFRVMRISIPGNTGDYFDLQLVVRHSEKDQLVRIQDGTYLKVVGRWQRESLNGIPYMISSKFTVTRPPRP